VVHEDDTEPTIGIDPQWPRRRLRWPKRRFKRTTEEVTRAVGEVADTYKHLDPSGILPLVRDKVGRDVSEAEVNRALRKHSPHRLSQ